MVPVGAKRLLVGGLFLAGVMTAGFGCIQFIPHTETLAYTLTGFFFRTTQAAGCAAVFTTVFTLIADLFPQHSTLMLVCVQMEKSCPQSLCRTGRGPVFFHIGRRHFNRTEIKIVVTHCVQDLEAVTDE